MQKFLIIILLNLLFYFKTLSYGYTSDDCDVPKDKPKGRLKQLYILFRSKALFNAPIEHLMSLVTHTLVCSLIYVAFGMNNISFWAAMLFSINPANLMGAVQLSSRHYATTTVMILLGYKFVILFPILYLGTLIFGFNPALLPMVFYGSPYWWFILLIPLWAFLRLKHLPKDWIAKRFDVNNASKTMIKMDFNKVIIGFKTLCYYTCFCLFPKKRGMYHDFLYTYAIRKDDNAQWLHFDKWFWGGVLILFTFITKILFYPSPINIGLLWWLSGIIFWCNILPSIQQPVAERYVYLANAGLMYVLAYMVFNIPDVTIRAFIISAIFIGYLVRSYIELPAFKDNQRFLDYNVAEFNFPKQYFAWTIKGEYELFTMQDWAKGLDSFRNAHLARKVCSRINFRLAYVLGALSRFEEALYHFDLAVKNPMEGFEDTRQDIAITSFRQGLEEGLKKQKDAIRQTEQNNRPKTEGLEKSGNPGKR